MAAKIADDNTTCSPEACSGSANSKTLLALDLGLTTGWAVRHADGTYTSGVWQLRGRNSAFEGAGMVFLRFRTLLSELIDLVKPTFVVFEEVRFFKGADAARLYGGFFGQLTGVLESLGIAYTALTPSVVKQFATGSGNAPKALMVVKAKERWPSFQPATDDEADARWIASCGACQNGFGEPSPRPAGADERPPRPRGGPRRRKQVASRAAPASE